MLAGGCIGGDGCIHSVYTIEIFEYAENIVVMVIDFRSDAEVLGDAEHIILKPRSWRFGLTGWRCGPWRACCERRASSCRS